MRYVILVAVAVFFGGPAHAGELVIDGSAGGGASTWKDDTLAYSSLDVHYRWTPRWSVFATAKSGYAEVDERILQHFAVGGSLWTDWRGTQPYLQLAINHQHESPRAAVENDIGALLGYGSGIRHRGGATAAAGVQFPFRHRDWGHLFASVEVHGDAMIGSSGPSWYWGGGVGFGFTYDFGDKK